MRMRTRLTNYSGMKTSLKVSVSNLGQRLAARALTPRLHAGVNKLRQGWLDPHAVISFSQEGEDLLLLQVFSGVSAGFYVDVGAHHPRRFSNTHLLYLQGWRGINIDATEECIELFRGARTRDLNLVAAIADDRRWCELHVFDEPALNTLNESLSESRQSEGAYRLVSRRMIETVRLRDLLAAHLPYGQRIDLLTVDVEGMDLEVLRSNDWEAYRPLIVMAEQLSSQGLDKLHADSIFRFLSDQGYVCVAATLRTMIFKDERRCER